MIIYAIKNKINDKIYIGKTTRNLEIRYFEHLKNALIYRKSNILYKAIRKYGQENFYIEVLEIIKDGCTTELNMKEKSWILKFNTIIPTGYNMTYGGDGGDMSLCDNFLNSMKKYSRKGKNNPMFGKLGKNNPNYGQKRGKNPLISKALKESWNDNRKKLASENISGKNNPMFGKIPSNAVKIKIDGILYNSLSEASKETGLSVYKIRKLYVKKIK